MADIFISLSGRDKAWGDWIAWQLKQAGHNVRYQHWDFQTGENFLLHMEEAGRKAERVLIVVSGNYFASDYTLRELTQAIYRDPAGRKGIIVPVIVEKYDLEGSLLGPLAYVDLTDITDEEAARRSLLAGLEKKGPPLTAPPFPPSLRPADVKPSFPGAGPQQLTSESGAAGASPLGRLHGEVPTLPGGYVERPEALDRLKRAILQSAGAVAVTGKTLRFGVQGMGGIGKTILTATLVRDKEIRRAFPDGIFWLTLGQHPNILAHQAQLARMLGDVATAFADVQEGRGRLNELLADRRALVVLDDVWSVPDAAAFTLRDTYSRLLVTTRMTEVVRGIDAAELELAELPPDQARQLLANFADLAEPDLPPEAEEIIKECGCLPLALAMVGAIAARLPGSWQGLLARLKSANLAKIRAKLPDYPYDDLLRAIQVSLDALDARERTRYIDLAVFPEDVAIPPVVLGVLWAGENLDELGVLELAEAFVARSLARWDARGNLTLHDLQRDVIRATAGDLPGLHRRLLTGYLAQCNDREGWSSGPDDG